MDGSVPGEHTVMGGQDIDKLSYALKEEAHDLALLFGPSNI